MPRANPARRDQLADAAIEVLSEVGARGLTHRAMEGPVSAGITPAETFGQIVEALVRAAVTAILRAG